MWCVLVDVPALSYTCVVNSTEGLPSFPSNFTVICKQSLMVYLCILFVCIVENLVEVVLRQ